MTTIAVNRTTMAADTQMDEDGLISYGRKIYTVNGDLIGFAGGVTEGLKFVEWYVDQEEEIDLDDTIAIVLTKHGEIFTYESHLKMEVFGKHHAVGSGAQAALAAMDCGHSPESAIKIASKRDAYTGSETISVKINEK